MKDKVEKNKYIPTKAVLSITQDFHVRKPTIISSGTLHS
jgi:hypothetical protein